MIGKLKISSIYKFIADNILSTSTLRKSSVTFSGTVANAILGAVFYILAARYLGPQGFGIMSVAIMILTLTSDMGDLGTDTGLVNFVSKHISKETVKAYRFLKLGLVVKTIVGLIVLIFGLTIADFIAGGIFQKPELEKPIQVAFMGVISMLLFSFIIHSLQALQKFWSWSAIQVAANLLRLIAFVGLFSWGYMTVEWSMFVYVLAPFIGFLVGLKLTGTEFLRVKNEWSVAKEFFKYNKWVAAFTILAALGARMDTFITARLLSADQVGIYSASNQLVKIVPQIVVALGTVIGPKMAEITNLTDFINYFKKTQIFVIMLSVLGLLTLPLVLYLVPFIFGNDYITVGPSFVILFVAMLIFLISVPVHMAVFYYYSYPKLFAYIAFGHLVLILFAGRILIANMGVAGAALTVLLGQIFDLIIPAVFVLQRIKKEANK